MFSQECCGQQPKKAEIKSDGRRAGLNLLASLKTTKKALNALF
jgi:hypothetical protein